MESKQLSIFDLEEGKRLRDEALKTNEENQPDFLEQARSAARVISRIYGTVNSNQVRKALEQKGIFPWHHNVWGSVFRGNEWEQTGEYVLSEVKTSHARRISVWRLRG